MGHILKFFVHLKFNWASILYLTILVIVLKMFSFPVTFRAGATSSNSYRAWVGNTNV